MRTSNNKPIIQGCLWKLPRQSCFLSFLCSYISTFRFPPSSFLLSSAAGSSYEKNKQKTGRGKQRRNFCSHWQSNPEDFGFSPIISDIDLGSDKEAKHKGSIYRYQKTQRKYCRNKMSSPTKRRDMDVMKLMMTDYKVETINDSMTEVFVEFHGPPNSIYSAGVWKVKVELPDAYPYKSPSIGFVNRIYHPNIDEASGSVCLDVINQTWSPMFDLVNIFEVFLPQLLLYPNASDPLNGEAAAFMMKDKEAYEQKVKEHCERYAKPNDSTSQGGSSGDADDSDDDHDDYISNSEDDMDIEGI